MRMNDQEAREAKRAELCQHMRLVIDACDSAGVEIGGCGCCDSAALDCGAGICLLGASVKQWNLWRDLTPWQWIIILCAVLLVIWAVDRTRNAIVDAMAWMKSWRHDVEAFRQDQRREWAEFRGEMKSFADASSKSFGGLQEHVEATDVNMLAIFKALQEDYRNLATRPIKPDPPVNP